MKFEGPIACVFAHPDDEVLGFGATSHNLSLQGIEVYPILVSGQADKRYKGDNKNDIEKKCRKACSIIGAKEPLFGDFPNLALHNVDSFKIVNFIENAFISIKPKIVVTHHPGDLNIDHKVLSDLCLAACRLPQRRPDLNLPLIRKVLFSEILSSTEWAYPTKNNQFKPNHYFQIQKDNLDKKILALEAYKNVIRKTPHPRNKKTINALATLRGSESGVEYAESFEACFSLYAI
ncbi:PIG-L deacetylase family protein [Prochlorococcus marinus]|uniref:PIG-L deacetylase family protein n=1 Tax=Prochlorococcus marinus TaxID=1219 RepID=UPI001ADA3266|nr:PIG-L deacetylase family protein [Prochlorococcus marinus]MBO8219558.1 PIG-L family deacetylase [Prochlorococcus marinus CUG1416]MBW3051929.1 N-acetylglucosaminylphosphatidylinositol deacetylase [Prochlorococcus marinus str. MU1416]